MTDSVIGDGLGMWNYGCANAVTDFPVLLLNATGDININVICSDSNPDPAGTCGEFQPVLGPTGSQVVGGTIAIFKVDGRGVPCSTDPSVLAHGIAHEVGHVLGLGHTSCANHVMSPNWPTSGVATDECDQADYQWYVPNEPRDTGPIVPSYDCPLVLDLNGDGIHMTGLDRPVRFFDNNGDDVADPTGWIDESSEDAFLWMDIDGDGSVQPGELFGSYMWVPTGIYAHNGFQALALYDSPTFGGNGDGVISAADEIWSRLRLWIDRDHDGHSDPHEIEPLGRRGIIELSLDRHHQHALDEYGNIFMLIGTYSYRVVEHGNRNTTASGQMLDVAFVRH